MLLLPQWQQQLPQQRLAWGPAAPRATAAAAAPPRWRPQRHRGRGGAATTTAAFGPGGSGAGLYGVLGVAVDASAAEIKAAWRRRAARLHPDTTTDPARAAELAAAFVEAKEAFETLSDGERRAEYDLAVLGIGAASGLAGSSSSDGAGEHHVVEVQWSPYNRDRHGSFEQQHMYQQRGSSSGGSGGGGGTGQQASHAAAAAAAAATTAAGVSSSGLSSPPPTAGAGAAAGAAAAAAPGAAAAAAAGADAAAPPPPQARAVMLEGFASLEEALETLELGSLSEDDPLISGGSSSSSSGGIAGAMASSAAAAGGSTSSGGGGVGDARWGRWHPGSFVPPVRQPQPQRVSPQSSTSSGGGGGGSGGRP